MFMEFCNLIVHLFGRIKYILIYYVLGAKSVLHDLVCKKYNHVELRDKSDHIAVVTGGARGIGRKIVQMLMECNMHVVIGCRDVEKGKATVQSIRAAGITKGEASVIELNLKSLQSVRKFASTFQERYKYLNLLVNNAGVMFVPYEETEDGFESHFAVNYLGHFLLTHLLLPAMVQAAAKFDVNPRIVNVSSCAHEVAQRINFDDINMKRNYIEQAAYAQSKLCQVMFAKTLNRHLKKSGSKIQTIAVHPGVVDTEIFNGTFLKITAPWVLSIFCKTPEQGAKTVTFCCIDDSVENAGGSYYSNCRPEKCMYLADDVQDQERLYELSTKAVKEFLPKSE